MSRSGESLVSVELRKEWIERGEPNGRPSMMVPFSQGEKGIWLRESGREDGVVGEERTHFSAFILRSAGCSCSERCWSARDISLGGPKIFPSSKYHEWKELGARLGRDVMMGWMPRAKRIGESGSPCWTPVHDGIVPWEWKRRAGVEWVKKNQGASCGMEVVSEERIVWREMVLNALERST